MEYPSASCSTSTFARAVSDENANDRHPMGCKMNNSVGSVFGTTQARRLGSESTRASNLKLSCSTLSLRI